MSDRKLVVRIIGDENDLLRSFKRSSSGAKGFERDISRAGRGALAGSGAFRSLGRSLAFASGAFLGVASATAVLRNSVDAAETLGKATRALNQQIKVNGENFRGAAPLIAAANSQMAALGHNAADSEAALARLTRATGDTARATKLMTLTANFAAVRHMNLAQAALIVGKVVQGTVTAFNRFGLVIKKGTPVTEALRIAMTRLAGQAAAAATPLEKLHAVVFNMEAAIGEALLPTINQLANSLIKWMSNTRNVERVQRDVRRAVKLASAALSGAKAIVDTLTPVFRGFARAVGGTRNAFELLFALGIAAKLRAISIALGVTSGAGLAGGATRAAGAVRSLTKAVAIFQASVAIGGFASTIRVGAALAAAKVANLTSKLLFLKGFGAIVIPVTVTLAIAKSASFRNFNDWLQGQLHKAKGALGPLGFLVDPINHHPPQPAAPATAPVSVNPPPLRNPTLGPGPGMNPPETPMALGQVKGQLDRQTKIQAQIQAARTAIARGDQAAQKQLVVALKAQIAFDRRYEQIQEHLLALGVGDRKKHAATIQRLQSDEAAALDELASIQQDAADKVKAAAEKARAAADAITGALQLRVDQAGLTASLRDDLVALQAVKANLQARIKAEKDNLDLQSQLVGVQGQINDALKQQRELAVQQRSARQFRALGLTSSGDEPVPGVKHLRAALTSMTDAVKGTFLDTSKTTSLLQRIRKVLSGGFGAITRDVRSKVAEMLQGIDQQLKDHAGAQTKFAHVSSAAFVKALGLDLTADQVRRLRSGISQLGAGNTLPAIRAQSFALAAGGGPTYILNNPQFHGVTDVGKFEDGLTKRAKQRGVSRRGPFAGRG